MLLPLLNCMQILSVNIYFSYHLFSFLNGRYYVHEFFHTNVREQLIIGNL